MKSFRTKIIRHASLWLIGSIMCIGVDCGFSGRR